MDRHEEHLLTLVRQALRNPADSRLRPVVMWLDADLCPDSEPVPFLAFVPRDASSPDRWQTCDLSALEVD